MRSAHAQRWRLARLVIGLCCLWLAGCAGTQLKKVVHEDAASPNGYVEVSTPHRGLLTVSRAGEALPVSTPLQLREGDEIETGPDAGAVIRFDDGNQVVLGPSTRVRLGSLEVLFGRLLAEVRGLFSVEDDTLVAGVEGTRFLFESKRGGPTKVMVLEGVVHCSSKTTSWPMIRLTGAQALSAAYGSAEPRIAQVSHAELSEIEQWANAIRTAPRAGFCCSGGAVAGAYSDACRGRFFTDEAAATAACKRVGHAPPPAITPSRIPAPHRVPTDVRRLPPRPAIE